MDILQLNPKKKANEGAFLHLQHPGTKAYLYEDDAQTKPVGLRLLGRDSDKFEQNLHKRVNDMISNKKAAQSTAEKNQQESIAALADLTVGWENLSINGDSNFSRENAISLYSQLAWVRESADEFVGNRANFL